MGCSVHATRKQEVLAPKASGVTSRFRNLELYRSLSFLLHDNGASHYPLAMTYIANTKLREIAST